MTPEEALKIDPARYSVHGDVATALRVLQNALRASQAQTVQMREDAALTVEDCLRTGLLTPGNVKTAAAQVRRLPLPAPAARTYEDGVRDAARVVRARSERTFGQQTTTANGYADAIEALLSPAPAVAKVDTDGQPYDAAGNRIGSIPVVRSYSALPGTFPAPAVAPVDDRCKALYPPTRGPRCGRAAGHDGAHDSGDGTGGPSVAWSDAVAPVAAPKPARSPLDPPEKIGAEDMMNPRPPKGTILDVNGKPTPAAVPGLVFGPRYVSCGEPRRDGVAVDGCAYWIMETGPDDEDGPWFWGNVDGEAESCATEAAAIAAANAHNAARLKGGE